MNTTISVKGPLAARLQEMADEEDLSLDQLVDFILRLYLEGLLDGVEDDPE
jgi:hypothetical protein